MTNTVVWGLSSSISIYKGVEAIRALVREGVRVIPLLSPHAGAFIQPLLLETLTGETVYSQVMQLTADHRVVHTSLAHEADLLVYAPASANLVAGLAGGNAADLLTTVHLAYEGWTLVAPAMNVHMWRHPAVQANLEVLRRRGVVILEPETGPQIDGDVGPGRLVEVATLVDAVRLYLNRRRDLEGRSVLVTAGPTREPIDPVRYLSNRSSGKMGFAIAEAAYRRGARVTLISGPTALIPHPHLEFIPVETGEDMFRAVSKQAEQADWIIQCAAVADFKPAAPAARKVKKQQMPASLPLEPTTDILAYLAEHRRPHQKIVGFAAETHDHERHAREKLRAKRLDAIVLNPVDQEGLGFESDRNQLTLYRNSTPPVTSPVATKTVLAEWLWDHLLHPENPA